MRSTLVGMLLAGTLGGLLFLIPPQSPAGPVGPEEELAVQVKKAIDKAKAYLCREQKNGVWEINSFEGQDYRGATISLALLALLTSGVSNADEQAMLNEGLSKLREIRPVMDGKMVGPGDKSMTYAVSLQTMVYAFTGRPEDMERIQENVDWLQATRQPTGWGYPKPSRTDNSNTQFALLALHEARRAGAKVDTKALEQMRNFFVDSQHKDGTWSYLVGAPSSITMTTAGVSSLLITGMDLEEGQQKILPNGAAENCGKYENNEPVARGINWIASAFPGQAESIEAAAERFHANVWGANQIHDRVPFYGLYGIERVGRLSGLRFIGGHDWYRVGCMCLVKSQQDDGSWNGPGADGHPMVATCFALLFLAKGRTPVLLTKFAYGQPTDTDWNHKHNDMRNVAEFASRELFKKQSMAWQIFDIRNSEIRGDKGMRELTGELLESPIVWFSGHDDVPTGNQVDLLKKYLENGGFVFAEACCGAEAVGADPRRSVFDQKFRKLVKDLFPDADLKPLDPTHPIYSASGKFITDAKRFPLWGIQQGCKTLLAYSPNAISGYWEANDTTSKDGKKAFEAAANVIAYATGLEPPRQKLDSVKIEEKDAGPRLKRGYFEAAQLRHAGEWKPAPKAMHNLMSAARSLGLDVVLDSKAVEDGVNPASPDVTRYRFLYMHGRGGFSYQPNELKQLLFQLAENHALLFADACCGNKDFDASFRKFMDALWADSKDHPKLEPIPPDDDLYSEQLNGRKIDKVLCRRETPDGKGVETEFHSVAPALEGIKINGRWVVIYSRYDIGCALEHHPTPGCMGHDYDSAVALGRAAVLYVLNP